MDPMRPGISVANLNETAGTLRGINWHVLQGPSGNFGDPILQPGPLDGGDLQFNTVGTLARSHLGFSGDCAVARISGRRFNPSILERNVVPPRVGRVNLGDLVVKSGRTTGVTRGVVRRVGVIAKIDYGGNVGEQEIGGFEIGPAPGADRVACGCRRRRAWPMSRWGSTSPARPIRIRRPSMRSPARSIRCSTS